MKKKCDNCLFSTTTGINESDHDRRVYPENTVYLCKVYPPKIIKSNSDEHIVIAVFPPICDEENWCTEWSLYES